MSSQHTLFVGNLPFDLSETEFKEPFNKYGRIIGCTIARKNIRGEMRSAGYGFIDFEDEASIQRCLSADAEIELKGRDITYRRSQPKPAMPDTCFVSGLTGDVLDEHLMAHFASCNAIDAKVVHRSDGPTLGFGFAKFRSEADRDRAIEKLDRSTLKGHVITVKKASRPFETDQEFQDRRHFRH